MKTPEQVKSILSTMNPKPKVTNAQVEAFCKRRGPMPRTPERLAEIVKSCPREAPRLITE